METHLKGLIITLLGVLFIVPDALFVRLIDAPTLSIAFWRLLISGAIIAIAIGIGMFGAKGDTRRALACGLPAWIYAAFLGASGLLFVISVSLTSVTNTVVIIAATPVFAALYSRLFLGEAIDQRTALTIVAVFIGLAVLAFGPSHQAGPSVADGPENPAAMLGNLAAFAVAACFAAALTLARKMRAVSLVPMVPVANIGAALVILPFTNIWAIAPESWPFIALHGGVFIATSTALLALGPRYLPSAEVALLILLETVFSPVLVWIILGEEPGLYALLGGGIVLVALIISNLILLQKPRV